MKLTFLAMVSVLVAIAAAQACDGAGCVSDVTKNAFQTFLP